MRLLSLSISNFKGIKAFDFKPNGASCSVYAANRVGKTSLADCLSWVLFNKNDAGQSSQSFDWKPRDKAGNEIHNLDTSASVTYQSESGDTLTLSKTTKENWVKKHGQKDQEFSGHTTTYSIDGVPQTQTEYDRYISGICDEKRFRALTNVRYVCEQIKWDDRRKLLLSLFGDISDADVIAGNPELKPLLAILGKRTVEDHKRTLTESKKATNNSLKEVRPRIDEQNRTVNEADGGQIESGARNHLDTPDYLPKLRADLAAAQERKAQVSSGGQVAELLVELRTLESLAMQIENDLKKAANAEVEEAQKTLRQAEFVLSGEVQRRDTLASQKTICETELVGIEGRLTELRADVLKASGLTFTFEDTMTCPVCKQPLPEDQVAAARAKGLEEFNEAKSSRLERTRATGQDYAAKRKVLVDKIVGKAAEITALESSIADLTQQRDDARAAFIEPLIDFEPLTDGNYHASAMERGLLEAKITAMREEGGGALASVNEQIEAIAADIQKAEAAAAAVGAVQKARDRIVELEAEEKRLAGEVDRMEEEQFLCEQFERARNRSLGKHLSANFSIIQWRLERTLINGGLEPCCEATIDGRGYDSALSNSEKIRVGLDICETFGRAWKFHPTIVIDNAEGFDDSEAIPATTAQQIRLWVSKSDKKLRFVADEPKAQEALLK